MDVINETVNLADKISEIIKNSPIYRDYYSALSKIKDNPETMEKIKQLKIKHLDYAHERSEGREDFNREKYISQEFFKVMLDDDVRTYFKNEEKLVNLVAEIYIRVAEKCELNLFV